MHEHWNPHALDAPPPPIPRKGQIPYLAQGGGGEGEGEGVSERTGNAKDSGWQMRRAQWCHSCAWRSQRVGREGEAHTEGLV